MPALILLNTEFFTIGTHQWSLSDDFPESVNIFLQERLLIASTQGVTK